MRTPYVINAFPQFAKRLAGYAACLLVLMTFGCEKAMPIIKLRNATGEPLTVLVGPADIDNDKPLLAYQSYLLDDETREASIELRYDGILRVISEAFVRDYALTISEIDPDLVEWWQNRRSKADVYARIESDGAIVPIWKDAPPVRLYPEAEYHLLDSSALEKACWLAEPFGAAGKDGPAGRGMKCAAWTLPAYVVAVAVCGTKTGGAMFESTFGLVFLQPFWDSAGYVEDVSPGWSKAGAHCRWLYFNAGGAQPLRVKEGAVLVPAKLEKSGVVVMPVPPADNPDKQTNPTPYRGSNP
ncbi:MAG: hypothetical protein KDH09_08140 [Chrysiogenetes bacterium]|nr:hypothetical protein [Chrysiogenetes bacterium]